MEKESIFERIEKFQKEIESSKIIKAVEEIQTIERELEEHTARIRQILKEKKANINQVALDNSEEATPKLLAYIKFGMGFQMCYLKSFNTNKLKATVRVKCSLCGVYETIEVTSKETYLRHVSGKERIHHRCESCEREQREREKISSAARQAHFENLKRMPYKEYLQTEHWLEFRKRVLKRYKYKCQLCGKPGKLNVHHNNYDHRGCEDYTDVLLLCQDCHAKHHGKKAGE